MPELGSGLIDQLCLACDKVLFRKVPLDVAGHFARFEGDNVEVNTEADDVFFVCSDCGAKNVVVSEAREGEGVRLRISHIKHERT